MRLLAQRTLCRSLLAQWSGARRGQSSKSISSKMLVMSPEVSAALRNDQPVVALESTIITHGMPWPTNLEMAENVEAIVRSAGAVPATIALINGKVHVGLTKEELSKLASGKTADGVPIKTSRRDFSYVIANKRTGGTTVSGTMVAAHAAGIGVFVTGGIGGVHRGAQESMDISADLTELGRTPVMVVSAGVKSILDIGLTLEYLETQGVCVATLGPSDSFPAFYTPHSGFKSPYKVESVTEAAQLLLAQQDLGLQTGILLGVPIPEAEAGSGEVLASAIDKALGEAEEKGISGRDVTPFILARLTELTGGESLRANLALVKNNARKGAEIAVEHAKLKSRQAFDTMGTNNSRSTSSKKADPNSVLVVGGCILDFVTRVSDPAIQMNGSTHKGSLELSHGGVGRNLADALARLSGGSRLVSVVGGDNTGKSILEGNSHIDLSLVKVDPTASTATYIVILDREGDCQFGVGDMDIHEKISPELVSSLESQLASAPLILSDGNVPESTLDKLLSICKRHSIPFFYEPTCLRKAVKPLSSSNIDGMTYCSPNTNELLSMARTLPELSEEDIPQIDSSEVDAKTITKLAQFSKRLIEHYNLQVILLTLGEQGAVVVRRGNPDDKLPTKVNLISKDARISAVHYTCTPANNVVSVSGAGDCLTAGFITALLRGLPQDKCVAAGMQAARMSCGVSAAVPEFLSPEKIDWSQGIVSKSIDL